MCSVGHVRRCLLNIPVLVTNLGHLEQQAYWKVSALCSAAGYNLTMKKHGYLCAHTRTVIMSSYFTSPLTLCFRSKFFASNGLLKEVNEVNKMNESLQAELQVRGCVCVCVLPGRHGLGLVLGSGRFL